MRLAAALLALTLLAAPPAFAAGAAADAPRLTPAQLEALKKQLQAEPNTPGRAAMLAKLLKMAQAMKEKQPVATADLLALVGYLRAANPGKANDPAFAGAMRKLEESIMKLNAGGNEDLDDLKREFGEGGEVDLDELKKEFDGY